jgi:hypothetical protein
MVFDNAIEAGSKLIANINKIRFYGKKRQTSMTRLLKEANKGESSITVAPALDIAPGDRLGLLPTSYASDASDYVGVKTYDNSTGVITLDK